MKKFLFLILSGLAWLNAFSQWLPTNGPYGGPVTCMAKHGQLLFAGTEYAGVYVSSDNGFTWADANNGIFSKKIHALASDGTIIYAGTDRGFFVSANNGETWSNRFINGIPDKIIYRVAANEQAVYIGVDSCLLRSTDQGQTWDCKISNPAIYGIGINSPTIFVGTTDDDLYRSTDNGENFQLFTPSFPVDAYSFAFIGNTVFMACNGGVMKSPDNGINWVSVNTGMEDTYVVELRADGNTLFAGTYNGYNWPSPYTGGIFKTTDFGSNWTLKAFEGDYVTSVQVINGRVVAGLGPGGLYSSADQGEHWFESNEGFATLAVGALGQAGTKLFANTPDGVMVSTNQGGYWSHLQSLAWFDCMVATPTAIIAGSGKLSRSADGGSTWQDVLTFSGYGTPVSCLVTCGSRIIAGTSYEGIYLSDDDGLTWTSSNLGLTTPNITSLGCDGSVVCAGTPIGTFFSEDGGSNWTYASSGLQFHDVRAVTGNNGIFLASGNEAYYNYLSGISRTTDHGTTWNNTEFEAQNTYATCFASSGGKTIAGLYYGSKKICFTDDSGITWSVAHSGLPNSFTVTSLAIIGQNVFASLADPGNWTEEPGEGVWSRPLAEFLPFALSQDSIWFEPGTGDIKTLGVTTTTPWTVDGIIPGWLNADKTSGAGTGNILFTTVQSNPYPVPRFASVEVESEGMYRQLTLCQKEKIIGVIGEEESNSISVFPNPTSGMITIDPGKPMKLVEISNATGKILHTTTPPEGKAIFDLSAFGKGLYFVRITGENFTLVKKVLVF